MRQINQLKKAARHHYEAYRAATSHLDCGATLAEHIRPDAAKHKDAFNNTMDELAKLDPSAPAFRL
jgi:hypothetical protein